MMQLSCLYQKSAVMVKKMHAAAAEAASDEIDKMGKDRRGC